MPDPRKLSWLAFARSMGRSTVAPKPMFKGAPARPRMPGTQGYNRLPVKIYRSEWIVPVSSPPIRNGGIAVERDRIIDVGAAAEVVARHADRESVIEMGDAVLLPAFVNAHTHVELSWMASEPLPRGDFMSWVRAMVDRRAPPSAEVPGSIGRAIRAIRASGTAAVGDVGNTLTALPALRASGLSGRFFLELIGARDEVSDRLFEEGERLLEDFKNGADSPSFPASLVPHGPHSVSPALLGWIGARARTRGDILSVHLAESVAEDEILRSGTGPFRALLTEIGAMGPGWRHPELSPAQVLDRAGLLGPRTVAVHGVHLSRDDARLLASRDVTLVLCPRSNARLGVGQAPVRMLLEEGVRLALGTDSLASNDDLDIFAELSALRRFAPDVEPLATVRAATLGGAEALGLSSSLGSIERGKRAALIALRRRPPVASPQGVRNAGRPRKSERQHATREPSAGESFASAVPGESRGAATDLTRHSGRDPEPYATIFAGPDEVRVAVLGAEG